MGSLLAFLTSEPNSIVHASEVSTFLGGGRVSAHKQERLSKKLAELDALFASTSGISWNLRDYEGIREALESRKLTANTANMFKDKINE
jgi:hypothetical protein